ncbi:thiopurine S-methyltransferase [Methylovulum psychrotolerans]|uniref:Thiopurine S-methyltransferase n=1 Tax=Methylovulum psychrotolerans TaxID=1704499 RepID=A0A2S5CLI0_9GAMM|nr:thiopurine S-methyltransferase [Methylovulum psychrotolerans]POZ51638.1 thiopurine S-methyltransferase [Methylovulum psychrotolerans]
MTSRDNLLWLQCWRDQQTDFNQKSVNPLLIRFWPGLGLVRGSRVFVPLCGKSLDMIWLAQQGHEVIGVELSPIAVRAFFRENHLKPTRRRVGQFTLWRQGRLSILCGDFFSLTLAELGQIDTVYDRAALTALPEAIRMLYIAHLQAIVSQAAQVFLLTTEDAQADETLGEALGVGEEITALYAEGFAIELTHVESVFERNPEWPEQPPERTEYKVYRLSSK